jgi:hypothetical protein
MSWVNLLIVIAVIVVAFILVQRFIADATFRLIAQIILGVLMLYIVIRFVMAIST